MDAGTLIIPGAELKSLGGHCRVSSGPTRASLDFPLALVSRAGACPPCVLERIGFELGACLLAAVIESPRPRSAFAPSTRR